ncbi:hypothetical protein AB4Z40_08810 [Bosea sp. 2YAB26]|uniref:hypothetical protein n=1 Tax=Bosea sp. 2YAB26 TaxID=3237478 RepID=UPI003F90600B
MDWARNTDEALYLLRKEIAELKEMQMMHLAIIQILALKLGVAPKDYQSLLPVHVPTPFDIAEMLKG